MTGLRRAERASVLFVGVWLVGALIGWGGPTGAAWASDVTLVVLAVVAAAHLGAAARRQRVGRRLPFVLLAAACGLWALGESIWTWYELVLDREVPFPSFADAAYLSGAPVAGAGLLALSRGLRRRSRRLRAVLDGWLVAGSLLSASWVFVLGPVVEQAEGGASAVVVAVAYPVTDVMLATLALMVLRRRDRGQRRGLVLVVAALLAMAVADSAFTGLALAGRYSSGGLVDLGWVAGYLLFAHAGRAEDGRPEQAPVDEPAGKVAGKVAVQLPYLLVAATIGVAGVAAVLGADPGPVGMGLLVSLVLALVVRQALTMLDNVALGSLVALRERHYRSLVQGAKDVIVLCGRDLHATYVSPSCLAVLGCPPEELVGRSLWDLVHPEDLGPVRAELTRILDGGTTGEVPLLRCRIAAGGSWIDTESTIGDLRGDPSVAGIVITTRDVSDRTALETQLRTLALQDSLTGLANRTLLSQRLEHALAQRRPEHPPVGLLLLDLDGFKAINDGYGHAAGDAVLVEVARRLTAGVRRGDTVARLGGDEFAVVLESWGVEGMVRPGLVAERLLATLTQPMVVDGRELAVGASMGLTLAGLGVDAEGLLRQADFALYASKENGRGRITVFGPELASVSSRRAELATCLGPALAAGQLHLAYQPVVDLASGRVTGAEALARWDHESWGAVSPSEFIPVAESTGLIAGLGRWALHTAATQAAQWEAQGLHLSMAVNVSVRQLGPDFVDDVAEVLATTSLTPGRLTLEITESVLVDDDRTLTALQALRGLGVRLALDDFGTGWSSLSYLRRLPVDVLKLDSSFVAGLGTSDADAVSRTVVRLALDLGLDVIAEGVETEAQRAVLLEMGCDTAQGWLFGAAGAAELVPQPIPLPRREPAVSRLRSRM